MSEDHIKTEGVSCPFYSKSMLLMSAGISESCKEKIFSLEHPLFIHRVGFDYTAVSMSFMQGRNVDTHFWGEATLNLL